MKKANVYEVQLFTNINTRKKKKNSDIRQSNQEHVIGVGTSVLNDTGLQVIMKRLWCRTRYRV